MPSSSALSESEFCGFALGAFSFAVGLAVVAFLLAFPLAFVEAFAEVERFLEAGIDAEGEGVHPILGASAEPAQGSVMLCYNCCFCD